MTYAMGEGLQMAIYTRLAGDPTLDSLVPGAVFDAVPTMAPDLFVALGPEKTRDRSDVSGAGAWHDLRVSIVTTRPGYLAAKRVAARVSDVLLDGALTLTRGRVASMRFLKAEAKRDEGEGTRRIDLWFRARLEDQVL
ncbi:MAG: DUF3168 domain-containing protein [Pseudomonadota bacterium]